MFEPVSFSRAEVIGDLARLGYDDARRAISLRQLQACLAGRIVGSQPDGLGLIASKPNGLVAVTGEGYAFLRMSFPAPSARTGAML